MTDIAVVDYGMGNLRSVAKAIEHVAPQCTVAVTSDPDVVRRSEVYFRAEYDLPFVQSYRMGANSAHFAFDTRLLPPRWVPKP